MREKPARRLPLGSYSLWIGRRGLGFFRHVAFDQLVTPRTVYIERGEVEAIVATASGCGVTVKEYGELLAHDPGYREKAARIAISVFPKPTSPQTRRSIGDGCSISRFTSAVALLWSGVSS